MNDPLQQTKFHANFIQQWITFILSCHHNEGAWLGIRISCRNLITVAFQHLVLLTYFISQLTTALDSLCFFLVHKISQIPYDKLKFDIQVIFLKVKYIYVGTILLQVLRKLSIPTRNCGISFFVVLFNGLFSTYLHNHT